MIEWVEDHVGSLGLFGSIALAVIAWLRKQHNRIVRAEKAGTENTEAITKAAEAFKALEQIVSKNAELVERKFERETRERARLDARIFERFDEMGQSVARIEGYLSGPERRADGHQAR